MSALTVRVEWKDLGTEDDEQVVKLFGYIGRVYRVDGGWQAYVRRPDGTSNWDTVDTQSDAIEWVEDEILRAV